MKGALNFSLQWMVNIPFYSQEQGDSEKGCQTDQEKETEKEQDLVLQMSLSPLRKAVRQELLSLEIFAFSYFFPLLSAKSELGAPQQSVLPLW